MPRKYGVTRISHIVMALLYGKTKVSHIRLGEDTPIPTWDHYTSPNDLSSRMDRFLGIPSGG